MKHPLIIFTSPSIGLSHLIQKAQSDCSMLLAQTVALVAALVPFANAHGSTGLPKIIGLDLLDRRAEDLIATLRSGGLVGTEGLSKSALEARADDRECGEGIGSCPQDKCCSVSGCMYNISGLFHHC